MALRKPKPPKPTPALDAARAQLAQVLREANERVDQLLRRLTEADKQQEKAQ